MKQITPIAAIFFVGIVLLAIAYAVVIGEKSELYIAGEVVVSPALQEKANNLQTIFIILRGADSQLPMPYGAYRDRVDFAAANVYRFVLTKEKLQLMSQQAPVPKIFNLKVRLDRDGLAGADAAGDLVGAKTDIAFGTSGVKVVLDKEIQ